MPWELEDSGAEPAGPPRNSSSGVGVPASAPWQLVLRPSHFLMVTAAPHPLRVLQLMAPALLAPPLRPRKRTPAPGGCSLLATPQHRSLMTRAAVFPHDVDLQLCPSGPSRAPESKCGLGSGALVPTACVNGTDRTGVGSGMFWYPQTPLR